MTILLIAAIIKVIQKATHKPTTELTPIIPKEV